ncbi:Mitochondrial pyruvate carrier 4 [Vitis vinifera]|uniref:Mitochondrial pyruvate carrier n=1 Tax=Vitis vinifera TaxID=29760 RepID=A0A438D3G8_VITVI|nr:Mitochondrial pyruvate carrier 4 [Vitis vinifera]
MAASKFQALWNHPVGPKTSEFSLSKSTLCCFITTLLFPESENLDSVEKFVFGDLGLKGFLFHFWAPTFKWGLSIANAADFSKPPEELSYPLQFGPSSSDFNKFFLVLHYGLQLLLAVASSGLAIAQLLPRLFCALLTLTSHPRNWNLLGVNAAMAGTGVYQLSRKIW